MRWPKRSWVRSFGGCSLACAPQAWTSALPRRAPRAVSAGSASRAASPPSRRTAAVRLGSAVQRLMSTSGGGWFRTSWVDTRAWYIRTVAPVEIGVIDQVAVRGVATAFPALRVSNEEALRLIGAGTGHSPDHLRTVAAGLQVTLGVEQRAWAHVPGTRLDPAHEESTLELAIAAGRAALDDAGVAPADVSLVLCATSTPHKPGVTVAAGVGQALSTSGACLDIRGGCAAALFGLTTAALQVAAGCGPVQL